MYLFVRWAPLLPICGVLGGGVFEFWEFHFQIDDAFVAHTYIFLCPVDSSWQLHGSQKKKKELATAPAQEGITKLLANW